MGVVYYVQLESKKIYPRPPPAPDEEFPLSCLI